MNVVFWTVAGIAVVLVGACLLKHFAGVASQATWLTLYRRLRADGTTVEAALLEVLTFLRRRSPFDQLTERDAQAAASILSGLADPELFTQVCAQVEASRDVRHLTDSAQLERFVRWANSRSAP